MHDDSSQNFVASQYAMYPSSEDDTAGYLVYPQMQQPGYPPVVHNPGAPPRGFLQSANCFPQPRSNLPLPVLSFVTPQGKCPTPTCSKRSSTIVQSI